MELTVTRRDQSTYTLTVVKGELNQKLLSQDVVSITVESQTPISFNLGDTITLFGCRYTINQLPKVAKGVPLLYDVEFEGEMYSLLHAQYLLYDDTGVAIESDFTLTGTLEDVARLAVSNLNRVYGNGTYVLGSYPATEVRHHVFNGDNVLAVMQRVCSDYGYEFELVYSNGVTTINIGSIGAINTIALRYGAGKGLYELERQKVQDKNLFTRLYAYGSSRNLPAGYRNYSRRLKLPGNELSYVQDNDAISTYGIIEATRIFDDIYPRRTGVITSVVSTNSFVDSSMDFDLNATDTQGQSLYLIPGNPVKVHFNTGNLAGYEFEVESYNHGTKTFKLKYYKDERGYQFPSSDAAFQLNVGDEYVLIDLVMPQSYIDAAELELQAKANELLASGKTPKAKYSCQIDPIYAKQSDMSLRPGDYIPIQDDELGIDRDFRVLSVKRNIIEPYRVSIELGDEVEVSLATYLVEQSASHEKIIALNMLNDPVKYRNSWRTALELQQMVFDQDGYFDTGNIRPLSINTNMLSVGSKSGQFVLNGIVFQPGYNGVANRIVSTLGTLSHYAIEDSIRTWTVASYDYLIPDNEARYIYIRCEVNGSGASVRYLSAQLKVDAEAGYYHFLVGVLHSVQDGYRKISLTYGSTTINGKEIKTGRITSQDGQTYFDLDAGEIRGKIVFRSGNDDQTIENNISTAQSTASSALIAAGNAQTAADTANTNALNRGNLLNWNGLRYKDYPIDTASYQDFAANIIGTTSENAIVSAIGPFGYETKVWEGKNVDGDLTCGGFYSRLVNISTTKKYMFVVWMRYLDDSVNGTVYFGTYPSRVRKVTDGSLDSNPYFASVHNRYLVKNRWYLFVGFINPDTYAGSTVSEATGIYDSVTRQRVIFDGTGYRNEFRFETGVTQVFMRAFSYGVSTGVRAQFYGAGVYECNGNEPTIEQLLSGAYTGTVAVRPNDLNLKAYYTFDKSVTQDDSFNSKTLTIVGTVSRSNSYIKGKAARFDRTGYLIRDDSSLKTSEVTISCWIYFNTVSTGVNGIFSLSYMVRAHVTTADYLTFSVYKGSSWVSIMRKLTAQKWYHVVFQLKQGTGGYVKMYVNGILVGIEYSDTFQYYPNNIFSIGVDYGNYDLYRFDGYIDDFRLYNYILADNEVLWLYTNPGAGIDYGAVKTVIDGGLVSSGTIMVGQGSSESDYTVKAGMTGQGEDEGSIRFWAGAQYANRYNAPFRVNQAGELWATRGNIAGWNIDIDKLSSSRNGKSVIIDPNEQAIKFKDGDTDKLMILNDDLPSLSSLVDPATVTQYTGANFTPSPDSWTLIDYQDDVYEIEGEYIAPITFTIQRSNLTVYTRIYKEGSDQSGYGGVQLSIEIWLADASGNDVMRVFAGRYFDFEYINYIQASTPQVVQAGTYKIKYKYWSHVYRRGNPYSTTFFRIGSATQSENYIFVTQNIYATILATNGLASFWESSKYLYLSHLESYFLQLLGSYKLMAGSNGIDCTSSRCMLKGVNPHTERTYIYVGNADVVISTYSFNVALHYASPSYVAILPSYKDIQSKFGISGYFSIVLNIVIRHTSSDSVCRLYGYSTNRSSTNNYNYPAIINSSGNTIEYISVSRGDTVTLLLEYASDGYRAFILGLRT